VTVVVLRRTIAAAAAGTPFCSNKQRFGVPGRGPGFLIRSSAMVSSPFLNRAFGSAAPRGSGRLRPSLDVFCALTSPRVSPST